MKPIIFPANETEFASNGLGRLNDCISCKVTEERNGTYELALQCSIDDLKSDKIAYDNYIAVPVNDYDDKIQPFRIYSIKKSLKGIITVNAEHISYRLRYIPVMPYSSQTIADAFSRLRQNSLESNPFVFSAPGYETGAAIYTIGSKVPHSARELIGGTEGSLIDALRCELEWDVWNVICHKERGKDSGVTIRYGRDLLTLEQEQDIENVVTGIYPYYYSEENGLVQGAVQRSQYAENYPFSRSVCHDFTADFENVPTITQLNNKAVSYMNANAVGVPNVNLTISFAQLWKAIGETAPQRQLGLCDYVTVLYEKLGIAAKAKVTKTVYDVLNERYSSITLGSYKTLSGKLAEIAKKTGTNLY